MKAIIVWLLTAAMVILALGLFVFLKPAKRPLDDEILERSRYYIAALEKQPLTQLSDEDRLILLHAYFNVKDYAATARVGEAAREQLLKLPSDRQAVFLTMVTQAYTALGQNQKALSFKRVFDRG